MLRILFISLLILLLGFFLLQGILNKRNEEKPIFLRKDDISLNHQTNIKTIIHSIYKPDSLQLETLKKDYSNIWAHLNHLYATNDVGAGKEFYTEDWFKQIVKHFDKVKKPLSTRKDIEHELHIQNWSSDGLVCTAIDSNVVLRYQYIDKSKKTSKATLAIALLFQGDNWRIDAIRVVAEKVIN